MADEWNFAQTTWDASVATETKKTALADKLQDFLEQTGWELTSWSPGDTGQDLNDVSTNPRYFTRTDHGSSDVWHYTGDGILQKCGIAITGDTDSDVLRVHAFLENTSGDDVQVSTASSSVGLIFIDTALASATADVLIIGGEWGLFFEIGEGGTRASVAMGMIATFMPWDFLNGTRNDERKWCTQGVVMDLFGEIRWTDNRNDRTVLNDGTNKNVTGSLQVLLARGNTDHLANSNVEDSLETKVGSFESMFGHLWSANGNINFSDISAAKYSFGLLSTPFDDRWRVSKALLEQRTDDSIVGSSVVTSSGSNNVAPSNETSWVDFRNAIREMPKLVVVGHLLSPWQNFTETTTSVDYFIVRVEDNGRPFNLGIEWPGAANELTVA